MLLRHGLKVRGLEFRLFYPKPAPPRAPLSASTPRTASPFARISTLGKTNQEIDFVFFLNGLPIVALELKHEKNQNVHDAVAQFAARDHAKKIFQHPFLYLAADTSDVMAATDPRREQNFRWHNTGLTNTPQTPGEYPVSFSTARFCRRSSCSKRSRSFSSACPSARRRRTSRNARLHVVPALSPKPHGAESRRRHLGAFRRNRATSAASISSTIPPAAARRFPSAGWPTACIVCTSPARTRSWWTSGFHPHRPEVARHEHQGRHRELHPSEGCGRPGAESRRPAALPQGAQADHRHHPTEVRLGAGGDRKEPGFEESAGRLPDRRSPPLAGRPDGRGHPLAVPQDGRTGRRGTAKQDAGRANCQVIREHDRNQLFVAFTATPAPATVTLFGAAFDTYTEAEAIAEGYIVDVAASIISYKTLYNLHCPRPQAGRGEGSTRRAWSPRR